MTKRSPKEADPPVDPDTDEFTRFERLARKLVRTSKAEINERRGKADRKKAAPDPTRRA